MNEPKWKQFELAVATFIESLDPKARVTHDVKLPDAHTGKPRQRDVWVEWKVLNHFPAKALISCKDWSSVLDQQDIDHFNGELISSKAQIGIIYSRSGFNQHALEKAQELGIHCCRLYENEPADIPDIIAFGGAFCVRSWPELRVHGDTEAWGLHHWEDVLSLKSGEMSIHEIVQRTWAAHQMPDEQRYERAIGSYTLQLEVQNDSLSSILVELVIHEDAFRAKVEFHRIEGSYNLTHGHFLGTQSTPSIDRLSHHPGEGWEPTQLPEGKSNDAFTMFLYPDVNEFLKRLEKQPIKCHPTPNDAA